MGEVRRGVAMWRRHGTKDGGWGRARGTVKSERNGSVQPNEQAIEVETPPVVIRPRLGLVF